MSPLSEQFSGPNQAGSSEPAAPVNNPPAATAPVEVKPEPATPPADNLPAAAAKPLTPSGIAQPAAGAAQAAKAADVYAMPKEFQHHNPVAGKNFKTTGALIMTGSFLFLLIIGVGFYMYIFNPGLLSQLTGKVMRVEEPAPLPEVNTPVPVAETPAATSSEAVAPSQSPSEVYLAYLKEVAVIKTFADYYALVVKYGSRDKISAADADKLLAESSPAAEQDALKTIKAKIYPLTGSETISEKINGQTAEVSIVSGDQAASGTITLVLETDAWKISQENLTLPAVSEEIKYQTGEDRDNDGLTDAEEDLLGADKENADSDGDGYSDLQEAANLYNPAGKDKLVDSPRIKSYLSEDGGFSLLYPSQWTRTANKRDNSVMFNSVGDDQFIQLMVFTNDNNETLDNYYRRLLGVTTISDSQRRQGETWQGLWTEDGLYAYLTDLKGKKFYVWQYSPGADNVLQYPNLFQAMIKSLVIKK